MKRNSFLAAIAVLSVGCTAASAATTLENTLWRATELNGELLEAEKRPELAFGEGGAIGGSGGCNRFMGLVEMTATELRFPDNMAATLMACPPPNDQIERDFFGALPSVTGYALEEGELVLSDAAGNPVLRFEPLQ